MRCLFTMFAEDVELLPRDSFTKLLSTCADDPEKFVPLAANLWQAMDRGDFAHAIREKVKRFNGHNRLCNTRVLDPACGTGNFLYVSLELMKRLEGDVLEALSWMRFLGFDLGRPTPDANTIRMFRERLTEAGAIQTLFDAFDRQLRDNGYLAMGGPLVDATLVQAPRQRNTAEEKAAIKAGQPAGEIWPDQPAKARQKDVDARWTVKTSRVREGLDGKPLPALAIPVFGYKTCPRA